MKISQTTVIWSKTTFTVSKSIAHNSIGCICRDEQQRLEEFSRLKYKIKILVNGGVVSETKERCVQNKFLSFFHMHIHICNYVSYIVECTRVLEKPDFSITYGEPFEIKMTRCPEIITLQVDNKIHYFIFMLKDFSLHVYTCTYIHLHNV